METFTFKLDLRPREMQERYIREGRALLGQTRFISHNTDGTKEVGEWETLGSIPNYGDVFDKNPSLFERIKGVFL